MAERPGVMFYFDVRPCLKRLTLEEKGKLFEAMLDYGEFGILPDFEGAVGVAWDFIQPRIDRDGEHYQQTVKARQGAANARWEKQRNANASGALQTMPTAESNSTANLKSKTKATKSKAAPLPPLPSEEKHRYGAYKNVLLSDKELAALKTEFPTDWGERVERLSGYIASTGKTYKSHFATIRNWARREKDLKAKDEAPAAYQSVDGVTYL